MRKKSIKVSKVHKAWADLKLHKRSTHNPKYNNPGKRDHTLATSVKFMVTGYGGDIEVIFKDDVTEEEVNKVVEVIEKGLT